MKRSMVTVLMLLASALWLGCVDGAHDDEANDELTGEAARAQTVANLLELGLPAGAIAVRGDDVILGGDAVVSLTASRELLGLERADGSTQERWRTGNIVGPAVTNICVNGVAFTGVFSTALNGALSAYNSLGLRFRFTRTTGSTAGCQAAITMRHTTGFVRQAGFPANGLPYPTLTLGTGFISFDVNSIRFQILHLFGHALGLLHADVENPNISCGPGSGAVGGGTGDAQQPGGVGGILIPGFPVATVGGSVMNSCYRATEPGVLTNNDRNMLHFMY